MSLSQRGTVITNGRVLAPDAPPLPATAEPSRSARSYLVGMLALVYMLNYLDRFVVNVVGQLIKDDLHISDAQLGVLSGIAFATLFALLGIPIARLAERFNRITIISLALALWSAMTCLSGMASSFVQLFLCRVGVGIGEAGCTPSAHSLLSDSFPPKRRATAIALYSLGVPIGAMLGVICGGWMGQTLGWRTTLLLLGAPGIVVALIVRLTLREPERGRFDAHTSEQPPPLATVIRALFSQRSFVHLLLGLTLATFAAVGISTFITPFVLRGNFGVNLGTAALIMGPTSGAAALLGTAAGGFVTDWAGRYDKRAYFWIPGLCLLVGGPLYAAALLSSDMLHFAIWSCLAQLIVILYLAPTFAVIHNMVDARMRASAIAVVYLIINLIGTGLGPVVVGWLSGHIAEWSVGGATRWNAVCEGVAVNALSADCRLASFVGVKFALIGATAFYLWGALHYFIAGARLNSRA